MVKIIMHGCNGHMGQVISGLVEKDPDAEIVAGIDVAGSAMSPQIYLGFLAEDKTVPGVVKYLFWMSGVFFLGLVLMVWFMRRRERAILVSFLFPVIFAFVLLMTPDINVNHKYIMISYAFLTIFWRHFLFRPAIQASHKSRYPDWEGSAGHTAGEPGMVRWYGCKYDWCKEEYYHCEYGIYRCCYV